MYVPLQYSGQTRTMATCILYYEKLIHKLSQIREKTLAESVYLISKP